MGGDETPFVHVRDYTDEESDRIGVRMAIRDLDGPARKKEAFREEWEVGAGQSVRSIVEYVFSPSRRAFGGSAAARKMGSAPGGPRAGPRSATPSRRPQGAAGRGQRRASESAPRVGVHATQAAPGAAGLKRAPF